MYCKKCNSRIDDDSRFCPFCGQDQLQIVENKKPKHHKKDALTIAVAVAAVIMVIAVFAVCGMFIYKSNKTKNLNALSALKETETNLSLEMTESDEAASETSKTKESEEDSIDNTTEENTTYKTSEEITEKQTKKSIETEQPKTAAPETVIETETQPKVPHLTDFYGSISNISATSQKPNETYGSTTYQYSPWDVADGNYTTCWCEGSGGDGIGDSITISFNNTYEINSVTIWNGLCTSEDLFGKNSRLSGATIQLSDGSSYNFSLADGYSNRQNVFTFPTPVETSSVTIVINGVYSGWKYTDTCISEISVA